METNMAKLPYPRPYPFKSYYVVWKPIICSVFWSFIHSLNRTMQYGNPPKNNTFAGLAHGLNRTMQYGNFSDFWLQSVQVLFKSYYVVWKRASKRVYTILFPSLNRTMQYGNYELSKIRRKYIGGLNRTMQYGNLKFQMTHNSQPMV